MLALLAIVAGRLPAQSGAASLAPHVSLAFMDSLPRWMAKSHVPAVAIGVLEGGRITKLETVGELDTGAPASSSSLFNVASLTKPVTAVTALALVSAGKLSLDESLAPYWIDPDIRDDPRYEKLTTRLILSHQTGFPNWPRMMPNGKLGFLADPGTKLTYSGAGYEYLRHALENKFGRTLQQLSDSILFAPLGMTETTYGWNPDNDSTHFAVGHDTNGVALHERKYPMERGNAADWLVTTIGDYSRFAAYVLNGAGLSHDVFREMMTPQIQFDGKPNEAMGLGWEVMDGPPGAERILLHTGSDDGIRTLIVLLPSSKRGLILFANGDQGMDVILQVVRIALPIPQLAH